MEKREYFYRAEIYWECTDVVAGQHQGGIDYPAEGFSAGKFIDELVDRIRENFLKDLTEVQKEQGVRVEIVYLARL